MGYDVTLRLDDATAATYRQAAEEHGRSLEEELRVALARAPSPYVKDCAALLRLSDQALAMALPDGPTSDSTLIIRWDRDTDHGRWVDDGWSDDDAGR